LATFTVCIPSYNAAGVIADTIESLLRQTFADWECLVVDDASSDSTATVVARFTDPRVRFISNAQNLGCAGNFQRCRELARGTFVYFLANDDVLSPVALERTHSAFQMAPDIAVVTRPYYWFEGGNVDSVIRFTSPLDTQSDRIISIRDDARTLRAVLDSLGQVSALAYRNEALKDPFSPHVWTTHIQPFLATLKTHRGVFLHDYPVAVRLEHSQARTLSSIYKPSPLWTWIQMMRTVFPGENWKRQRKIGIDNISRHVEGVVQVRCHSTFGAFLYEAVSYLRYRPLNSLSLLYWAYAVGCMATPPALLRKFVDRYRLSAARTNPPGIKLASLRENNSRA
jgi:glycosyltransferase involved in cell wall biosynthesis